MPASCATRVAHAAPAVEQAGEQRQGVARGLGAGKVGAMLRGLQFADDLVDVAVGGQRLDVVQGGLELQRGEIGKQAACAPARLLDGLAGEGAAPPLVLWALANEIRTLATIKGGQDSGQPLPALLKAERVFDERRKQAISRALPRLSSAALRAALLHAARIDRIIKGLAAGDVWDEFLQLSLRLAAAGVQQKANRCSN